jgi:hypothetical protein
MTMKGRVWFTASAPPDNPAFCKKGSNHPSAKVFPLERATRHLSMYDPKTKKFSLISTCFATHHLVFAEDTNHTLWTSAGGGGAGAIGWLNRKMFDETGDEEKSQGWAPFILDTNGNGKRDEWVEPNEPVEPAKDKRVVIGYYGVAVNPVDGSIWGSSLGFPGYVARFNPGPNPRDRPYRDLRTPVELTATACAAWISTEWRRLGVAASGHLGFDRRKCKS